VPPRVDYALTPLGETLLETIGQLVSWADAHIAQIQAAQAAYDTRSGPPPCPDAELPDEDVAAS
jgi:DNA-binding HxlR family transcriptional regulator